MSTARDGLEQAERSLREADFDEALDAFTAVLTVDCVNVEAKCGRVRALWVLRKVEQARRELDNVAQVAGDHPAVHIARGTLALGLPDHPLYISITYGSAGRDDEQALAEFSAAVDLAPESVSAWRGLAMTHRLAWRLDEAHRTLDAALAHHPGDPGLRIERAWCLYEAGRIDQARAELVCALTDAPDNREALLVTALFARIAYDYDAALAAIEALRRQCPDHVLLMAEEAQLEDARVACHADPEAYRQAKARAEDLAASAYRLHPEWPAMLYIALHMVNDIALAKATSVADVVDSPLFVGPDRIGSPPSPTLLECRGLQLARCAELADDDTSRREAALEAFRAVRVADPHHTTVCISEAPSLTALRRFDDARRSLRQALAHTQNYPAYFAALGWVELYADRYEAALDWFERAGRDGELGRIITLCLLGCFDLAERAANDAAARWPADTNILNALAQCAREEGWYFAAYDRFTRSLEFEPEDTLATKERRKLRWLRRLLLPRWFWRKRERGATKQLTDNPVIYDRLDRRLPDGAPLQVRAMMRALDRGKAVAGGSSEATWDILGIFSILILAVVVLFSPLLTFRFDAFTNSWLTYGSQVALNLVLLLGLILLLVGVIEVTVEVLQTPPGRVLILVSTALTAIAVGGLIWVRTRQESWLGKAMFVGLVSLCYLLAAIWLFIIAIYLLDRLTAVANERAHRRAPLGSVTYALLDLLDQLDAPQGLARPDSRARCLDSIERIARSVPYALATPTGGVDGRRRPPAKSQQVADRRRAAGVVSAIRDLKEMVRSPKRESWADLHAQATAMLTSTAYGYWGELPSRTPDPVTRVLLRRILIALRGLAVVTVPPLALAAYQTINDKGLADLPLQVALIVYVGWPLLSLMWWLDPSLPAKLDALRNGRENLDSKQAGPSHPGG